jgi:hypothetical protein
VSEPQLVIESETEIIVTRYGTRFWAIYLNGQLLAVTVYKKGALAVQAALTRPHS